MCPYVQQALTFATVPHITHRHKPFTSNCLLVLFHNITHNQCMTAMHTFLLSSRPIWNKLVTHIKYIFCTDS